MGSHLQSYRPGECEACTNDLRISSRLSLKSSKSKFEYCVWYCHSPLYALRTLCMARNERSRMSWLLLVGVKRLVHLES